MLGEGEGCVTTIGGSSGGAGDSSTSVGLLSSLYRPRIDTGVSGPIYSVGVGVGR